MVNVVQPHMLAGPFDRMPRILVCLKWPQIDVDQSPVSVEDSLSKCWPTFQFGDSL